MISPLPSPIFKKAIEFGVHLQSPSLYCLPPAGQHTAGFLGTTMRRKIDTGHTEE